MLASYPNYPLITAALLKSAVLMFALNLQINASSDTFLSAVSLKYRLDRQMWYSIHADSATCSTTG